MYKQIPLPPVLDGTGAVQYAFPESIGEAKLKSISATFTSTAVGSLDIFMAVSTAQGDIKTMAAVPNTVAAHAAVSYLSWGSTGAYYLATHGAGDIHHIPLQDVEIEGGDILTMTGICAATEGWQNMVIWIEMGLVFN